VKLGRDLLVLRDRLVLGKLQLDTCGRHLEVAMSPVEYKPALGLVEELSVGNQVVDASSQNRQRVRIVGGPPLEVRQKRFQDAFGRVHEVPPSQGTR
jgi:hypothetical protein